MSYRSEHLAGKARRRSQQGEMIGLAAGLLSSILGGMVQEKRRGEDLQLKQTEADRTASYRNRQLELQQGSQDRLEEQFDWQKKRAGEEDHQRMLDRIMRIRENQENRSFRGEQSGLNRESAEKIAGIRSQGTGSEPRPWSASALGLRGRQVGGPEMKQKEEEIRQRYLEQAHGEPLLIDNTAMQKEIDKLWQQSGYDDWSKSHMGQQPSMQEPGAPAAGMNNPGANAGAMGQDTGLRGPENDMSGQSMMEALRIVKARGNDGSPEALRAINLLKQAFPETVLPPHIEAQMTQQLWGNVGGLGSSLVGLPAGFGQLVRYGAGQAALNDQPIMRQMQRGPR